jgi:hypothetical protein
MYSGIMPRSSRALIIFMCNSKSLIKYFALFIIGSALAKKEYKELWMINLLNMLGIGLIKKERKSFSSKSASEKLRKHRKKVSVETFLRESLGTHLIEKKF